MMTREEAIEILESHTQYFVPVQDLGALNMALSALCPVSQEQVEKVWRGEWIDNGERDLNGVPGPFAISCKRCRSSAGTKWMRFCPHCGAAMTGEAVQMVMERLEKLHHE